MVGIARNNSSWLSSGHFQHILALEDYGIRGALVEAIIVRGLHFGKRFKIRASVFSANVVAVDVSVLSDKVYFKVGITGLCWCEVLEY